MRALCIYRGSSECYMSLREPNALKLERGMRSRSNGGLGAQRKYDKHCECAPICRPSSTFSYVYVIIYYYGAIFCWLLLETPNVSQTVANVWLCYQRYWNSVFVNHILSLTPLCVIIPSLTILYFKSYLFFFNIFLIYTTYYTRRSMD